MSSASRRLPFSVAAALLGAPTASFAQAQDTPATPSALHATAFAVGLGVAAWMAVKAFDRPSSLAGLQTPPRYTTRNTQYLAGRIGFTAMCALLYSVLIVGHAEVLPAIKQLSPALYEQFVPGGGTSNYLLAVVLVTSFFLAFLNLDQEWNPLNMLREVIRSWVSIPQLASNLVARGEVGLDVPQQARAAIVAGAATPYVAIGDFEKDRDSIDRIWAELAYLYAWLRRQDGPADATFFQDPSFGWSELSAEFGDIAARIGRLKDGYAHAAMEFPDVKARVFALRKKMWRVVACYLVFKNGTDEDVSRAARALGIPTEDCVCENPLRYAVIYILGICGSVWLSVTMSAILFDWVEGRGLLEALGQSSELVTRWIAFSAANIGVPIIVILAMRYIGWRANPRTQQAYLVSYCWVFVVALAVAPLSLGAA